MSEHGDSLTLSDTTSVYNVCAHNAAVSWCESWVMFGSVSCAVSIAATPHGEAAARLASLFTVLHIVSIPKPVAESVRNIYSQQWRHVDIFTDRLC